MNKNLIFTLMFLTLLLIAIRVPSSLAPIGLDTYQNINSVQHLVDKGYLAWNYNILSLMGFTPLSYPSGEIYFAAINSIISGLTAQTTVLIISMIIGIIALFSTFSILRKRYNQTTAFFASLCFLIAPYFLFLTTWSISTRGLLIALLPSYILTLIKFEETRKSKYLWLSLLILVTSILIHRLGAFFILIAVLFYISYFIYPKCKRYIAEHNAMMITIYVLLALALFAVQFTKYSIYNPSLGTYKHSIFFNGNSVFVIFMNFLINYVTGNGIMIAASVVGIIWLIWKGREKFDIFMLLVFIISCNFFIDKIYFRAIFIFFISILTGIGMDHIIDYVNRIFGKKSQAARQGDSTEQIMNQSTIHQSAMYQSTIHQVFIQKQATYKKPIGAFASLFMIFVILASIGFSIIIMNRTSLIDNQVSQITADSSMNQVAGYINNNYDDPTVISSDGSLTYLVMDSTNASTIDTRVLDLIGIKALGFNSDKSITDIFMRLVNIKAKLKLFFSDWLIRDNTDYYIGRHEYALKYNGMNTLVGNRILKFYNVQLYLVTQDPEPVHQQLLTDAAAVKDKIYNNGNYELFELNK